MKLPGRKDCTPGLIEPSGCDSVIRNRIGIECPYRLFQAVAHFLFFVFIYPAFIETQHLVPVLNLGLEKVSLGRFHILCPLGAAF
jgi:hypothetical protein